MFNTYVKIISDSYFSDDKCINEENCKTYKLTCKKKFNTIYVDPSKFIKSEKVYYILNLPDVDKVKLGSELKIILTGNLSFYEETKKKINFYLYSPDMYYSGSSYVFGSHSTCFISELGLYGFATFILSKNINNKKIWLLLDSTGGSGCNWIHK